MVDVEYAGVSYFVVLFEVATVAALEDVEEVDVVLVVGAAGHKRHEGEGQLFVLVYAPPPETH